MAKVWKHVGNWKKMSENEQTSKYEKWNDVMHTHTYTQTHAHSCEHKWVHGKSMRLLFKLVVKHPPGSNPFGELGGTPAHNYKSIE